MTSYMQVDLSGPSAVGVPGPLPAKITGLDDATLADLSSLSEAVPEYNGIGFWPMTAPVKPALTLGKQHAATPTITLDAAAKTATETYAVENMPVAERAAVLKADATARQRSGVAAGMMIMTAQGNRLIGLASKHLEQLTQAKTEITANGAISAVTQAGERVDLPDTATVDALLTAMRARVRLWQSNEASLYDGINTAAATTPDDAAKQAALDLIDTSAGWPA